MNFFLLGLNHRTSPLELREKFTMSPRDIEEFYLKRKGDIPTREFLALSTCNRTEIYGAHDRCRPVKEDMIEIILEYKNMTGGLEAGAFYYAEGDEAVKHLFRVSSGIDSMVVGEAQILGQVKGAYSISTRIGSNGPLINKIFHHAFRVGKRARTETDIGRGIVSVSHAAVELSRKIYSDLKDKSVLLLGSGETGELAVSHFVKAGVKKIWVCNRSQERAREVCSRLKGSAVPFDSYKEILQQADIAVFSTSSGSYLLEAGDVPQIFAHGRVAPLFILDISVPRNVDPRIAKADHVFLYDIDDLDAIVKENLRSREGEVSKVEGIIKEEINKYRNWSANLQFEPLLKLLKEEFEAVRKSEISKNIKRLAGKEQEVEEITRSILNKILNRPFKKLKSYDVNSHAYVLRSALLEELFRPEDE